MTKIIDVYNSRYPAIPGYQTDLSKWMLATLSLINAGALAGIFHEDKFSKETAVWASPFFAAGVGLAVILGLCSWINTNIAITIYDDIINPHAITDLSMWTIVNEDDPRHRQIITLARCAIGSGVASLLAAAAGAIAVWMHL